MVGSAFAKPINPAAPPIDASQRNPRLKTKIHSGGWCSINPSAAAAPPWPARPKPAAHPGNLACIGAGRGDQFYPEQRLRIEIRPVHDRPAVGRLTPT